MGFPWFKIVWLFYTNEQVTNDQCYVERWLVISNKSKQIVDSYDYKNQAEERCDYLNAWWEKDYRAQSKMKGNALWASLLG
jgi:hypothetical protein